MGSQQAFPHGGSLSSETVEIEFEMTAGTAGAVPATFTKSYGVASVTLSTNDYLFVLDDGWAAILPPIINIIQATPATTTARVANMSARSASAGTFTISPWRPDTGAATPLSTGDILQVTIRVQRNDVDAAS